MDLKATDTMIIDASLLRAQRLFLECHSTNDLQIETAYMCICCRGVYAERIPRCCCWSKRGKLHKQLKEWGFSPTVSVSERMAC